MTHLYDAECHTSCCFLSKNDNLNFIPSILLQHCPIIIHNFSLLSSWKKIEYSWGIHSNIRQHSFIFLSHTAIPLIGKTAYVKFCISKWFLSDYKSIHCCHGRIVLFFLMGADKLTCKGKGKDVPIRL